MTQPIQAAVQEYRLTPSFTSDTHILLLTAGVARWTQIRDARGGATVIQSLPSGNVGDVRRAQLATLQRVWFFEEEEDDIIIQIGKAYLIANHPILTAEGWLLASQAAAKGYGQLPSDREFSQLCGLQLATGGNVLINTSTTQDLASVYIEAATLGYSFLSSPEPLIGNFPTYAVQKTGHRYGSADQSKPSYSQVTTLHPKRVSERPIPLFTPETHASLKSIAVSDKTAQGPVGEPTTGLSALGAQTAQRIPEECSGDLDAARTGSQGTRPTGNQQSGRVVMQGDGTGGADEGHEAVRRAQDNREGNTGNATSARGSTGPTLPRLPASSSAGLNNEQTSQGLIKSIMHDDSLSHPEKTSRVLAIWASEAARGGIDGTAADVHSQRVTTDTTNTTCHATPAIGTPANSASVTHSQPGGSGTPDTYSDILIQTPKGEGVHEHEIRWGPNPQSEDGGHNLELLEVEPGHHLFRASRFALDLCKMVDTDPRSQFYKTTAIGNSHQTPEPPYLRGNGRSTKRSEIYASRRQTRAKDTKEQTGIVSPGDIATAPSHKQEQGRLVTNPGVPSVSQGPNPPETEAIPHDDNLFYKNGKPKPITNVTARPRARGLTSKARKRLGAGKETEGETNGAGQLTKSRRNPTPRPLRRQGLHASDQIQPFPAKILSAGRPALPRVCLLKGGTVSLRNHYPHGVPVEPLRDGNVTQFSDRYGTSRERSR